MRHKKLLVGTLVVLALLFGGYFALSHYLGNKAWESFSLAVDSAVGEAKWKAGEHTFSLFKQTLTVNDFEVLWGDTSVLNPKLSLSDATEAPEGAEGAAPAAAAPEGEAPAAAAPEGAAPATPAPEGEAPAAPAPEGEAPAAPAPEGDGAQSPADDKDGGTDAAPGAPGGDSGAGDIETGEEEARAEAAADAGAGAAAPADESPDGEAGKDPGAEGDEPQADPGEDDNAGALTSEDILDEPLQEATLDSPAAPATDATPASDPGAEGSQGSPDAPEGAASGDAGGEAPPDAANVPPVRAGAMHIVKIEIKRGISEGDLRNLLNFEDWNAEDGKEVFDKFSASLLTVNMADGEYTVDLVVESVEFGKTGFTAAKGESGKGLETVFKHLSIESFELKNFKSFHRVKSNPMIYQTTAIGHINLKSPDFGENLKNLENPGDVLQNFSAELIDIGNFWGNIVFNKKEVFRAGFGGVQVTKLVSPGLTGTVSISDINYKEVVAVPNPLNETEPLDVPFSANLKSFNAQDLDLSVPFDRVKYVVDSLQTDYYSPTFARVFSDIFRASDVFTLPVSVTNASFGGFRFENGVDYVFTVETINFNGPFKANVLPEKGTISANGVSLSFPENLNENGIAAHIFEKFLQFTTLPSYTVSFELNLSSEPAVGDLQVTLSSFVLNQLAAFSGIIDLSGLTEENLKSLAGLSNKPFQERVEPVLLRRLAINYVDSSLVNKIFEFNSQQLDVPIDELKDAANGGFENWLESFQTLEDTSDIVTGFGRFTQSPTSLTFDATPQTPLSLNSKSMGDDPKVYYNALNMTLRFNQGGLCPIKFITAEADDTFEGPDDDAPADGEPNGDNGSDESSE